MIAYTASYYGISPLDVESWRTSQVAEWHDSACRIEDEKAKQQKKAMNADG
ncbi:hypothetical protein [Chitinophaga sp. sic0106]|uniref:hypothetical protein n=1 Tax=Chitinophaga sp. sic0106 TaxID=2854785 RepID=UPI001C459909|nr:hypothetical protein [Chitinophaga sp. sic0106]MBV7529037.1 hypothetical protein [Chitinophaga sp. sic0106]